MSSRGWLGAVLLLSCGSGAARGVAESGGGSAAAGQDSGGGARATAGAGGAPSKGGAATQAGSSNRGGAGNAGASAGGVNMGGTPSSGGAPGSAGKGGGGQAGSGGAPAFSYQTDFGLTESPLSESGVWHNKGLDWTNVVTAGGLAYGTQEGHPLGPYDDSYAILNGWPPDQYAEATIHIEPGITAQYQEVEILLRWSDAAHYSTGYECNLAFNGSYATIGRWPGALGTDVSQYTTLCPETASPIGAPKEGDILAAQIVGYTITSWVIRDGVKHQLCTGTDDKPGKLATGSPGIGFYAAGAPANNKFSFTSFRARSL